ncbi:MAG: class I SAM-dependent methyltransferase [Methanosarcinaceae archaeon]
MNLKQLLENYQTNVKKIWNLRAIDIYNRWKDETGDFKFIENVLDKLKPSSILDIGFGYGRTAPVYAKVPFVIGMDISYRMLTLAKHQKIDGKKIPLTLGDIRLLPFRDESYSCLISVRTMNHIHPNEYGLVEREISRVSRYAVILLESDVKVPNAKYEFEHDYDQFLKNSFIQSKIQLEKNVYLRTFIKRNSYEH